MGKTEKLKAQMLKRRLFALVFAVAIALAVLIVHAEVAQAASLSLKASASSVKIGDTVTVTITVPGGVSATVSLSYPTDKLTYVSASDTANANAGTVAMTIGSYGGSDEATSATVTFKASGAGKATFSVSAPIAGDQTGDQVSVDGASTSITVENAASEEKTDGGTGDGDEDDNSKKSADNSLSTLSISPGTLSPEFKYSTTSYTAKVDNNVTSVAVSAKTSNSKATIESVTGADSLSVGDNKIQIVVKAENGVTATYTITVTRAAAGDGTGDDANTDTDENNEDDGDDGADTAELEEDEEAEEVQYLVYEGEFVYPSKTLPLHCLVDGFERSTITLWGEEYECLASTTGDGTILLWVDRSGDTEDEGADEDESEELGYYIVLSSEMYAAAEEEPEEEAEAEPETETEELSTEDEETVGMKGHLIIGIVVIVILVIVIAIILIFILRGHGPGGDDDDDDDDLEFIDMQDK